MAQLIEVWDEVHTMLAGYSAQQIHQLQAILFSVLGKYDISRKEETTDLVEYDEGMKGYTMFFVAKRVQGLSAKSLNYYKNTIDKLLETVQKPITQITTDDVRWYLAQRQVRDKVSPSTMDNERRIFSTFFGWLSGEGYIPKDICKSIKKVKTPKRKKKAFSEVEVQRIKDACFELETDIEQKRSIALVEFLLSTGCRIGEVSILKKNDIDLENRTALVYGKGCKERIVYLNQISKMRLLEYWDARKYDSEYAFAPLKHRPKQEKGNVSVSALEKSIHDLGKIAGIENCHPHRLRRTCATTAIKKGMSIIDVQRLLGHESMETTKIYLDLDDTDLRYQHEKYM